MTLTGRWVGAAWVLAGGGLVAAWAIGCRSASRQEIEYPPVWGPKTFAVAPALNASGSRDFDPVRVGDLAASELAGITGVRVIGVSRVMAALANSRRDAIRSPADALQVARDVGADGIIVFAVTEYDPYEPPVVGLSMQLYAPRDPFALASAAPAAASSPAGPTDGQEHPEAGRPWAQVQRVFNASHDAVVADVKEYARKRDAEGSAYGWRKYLVSQELFLRFCLRAALAELLSLPPAPAERPTADQEAG